MRLAAAAVMLLLFVAAAVMLVPASHAFAQQGAFDVVKTKGSESFSIAYTSANADRKSPFIYTYELPKGNNWIAALDNALSYTGDNSKTVVILRDKESSEKFVEVQMFGDADRKYSVWIGTEEGRANAYLNEKEGWSTDQPIGLSYAAQNGLTVTDGKRTVIDRLDMGSFDLGSIEVYGRDEPSDPPSTNAGHLNISVIYGNPADTPTYLVPALVTGGVGSVVGILLVVKKRRE
ncbi:MAG: hypothetical protein ABI347_11295 [Nitrososphaera sp.]|jgi:hypothetical protein